MESMMTGSGRKSFRETQGRAGTEKIRNRKHALHALFICRIFNTCKNSALTERG